MANCKHCNAEFNDNTSRGQKKLYCTLTCSRKAAIQRANDRMKQKILNGEKVIETTKNDNQNKIRLSKEYIYEISVGVLSTFYGICKDRLSETEYDILKKLLTKAIQQND